MSSIQNQFPEFTEHHARYDAIDPDKALKGSAGGKVIFIAGASREELPLDEVGRKVAAGGGDFALGKNLAKMLDGIDRKAPKDKRHLYLARPLAGVFNPAALGEREIILCESVLDALTFCRARLSRRFTGTSRTRSRISAARKWTSIRSSSW